MGGIDVFDQIIGSFTSCRKSRWLICKMLYFAVINSYLFAQGAVWLTGSAAADDPPGFQEQTTSSRGLLVHQDALNAGCVGNELCSCVRGVKSSVSDSGQKMSNVQ